MLGGLIQGVGYVLLACCPLGLVVRVGQGSRFHILALAGVAAGAAVFGHLRTPIVGAMSPWSLEPRRAPEAVRGGRDLPGAIPFSLATVDGGRISYGPEAGRMRFRHERPGQPASTSDAPVLLVYVAPPC